MEEVTDKVDDASKTECSSKQKGIRERVRNPSLQIFVGVKHCRGNRLLTVKLRGRPTTPDRRRGRTLSPGARGANQTTPHGPLQRLLDGTMRALEVTRTSISG